MPLELQRTVLELVCKVTGCQISTETPVWLKRPGKTECGQRWKLIKNIYFELTGYVLPDEMPRREYRKLDGILIDKTGGKRVIEIDEVQHFNCFRAKAIEFYPSDLELAFDRITWQQRNPHLPKQGGGWAKPKPPLFPEHGGRHLQRAFRDALADLVPQEYGFLPTLRIGDFEVKNLMDSSEVLQMDQMQTLLAEKHLLQH